MKFNVFDFITFLIVIIGAVNWGTIAFMNFDIVSTIFGAGSILSKIIFGLVGLCGLYVISFFFRSNDPVTR